MGVERNWGRRRIAASLAAAFAALVMSATAVAAPNEPVGVRVAKHDGGPYHSFTTLEVGDRAKSLYFRVLNRTEHKVNLTLTDEDFGATGDYEVNWFHGNAKITHPVRHGGFGFSLRPDSRNEKAMVFEVQVKATTANPGGLCVSPRFHGTPVSLRYPVPPRSTARAPATDETPGFFVRKQLRLRFGHVRLGVNRLIDPGRERFLSLNITDPLSDGVVRDSVLPADGQVASSSISPKS